MGSPRSARDDRSPPDAACLTSKEIITQVRMLTKDEGYFEQNRILL
jgi:hypothetical protein